MVLLYSTLFFFSFFQHPPPKHTVLFKKIRATLTFHTPKLMFKRAPSLSGIMVKIKRAHFLERALAMRG